MVGEEALEKIEKTKGYIDYAIRRIEKKSGFGESLYLNTDDLEIISKALEKYLNFTDSQQKAAAQVKLTYDNISNVAKNFNAIRIILEDSYLVSQLKDYYENMWSDIHDENDMEFMKRWSNEAYKNRYSQGDK